MRPAKQIKVISSQLEILDEFKTQLESVLQYTNNMRPAKQIKVISSQLEILDELKTQLETVLDYTNNVIEKGNSWIKEENNETFLDINKILIYEIGECINQCQDITKDKNEGSQHHSDLQEQDTKVTRTKPVDALKSLKSPEFHFRERNEFNQLFEKCQEMEKTISLHSKKFKKFEQKFQEHKNETKDLISKEKKESENQYRIKFDEIMEEFHKASNFMTCLETQNKDVINQMKEHDKQMTSVIKTLHSVQEQIKEHEQKSETIMKQQKSTENSFSLRLDEVKKDNLKIVKSTNKLNSDMVNLNYVQNFDTLIPNVQVKLKDLEDQVKALESTCKDTVENNRKKFDDIYNNMKSTDLHDKILNVSSQVEKISKDLICPRQQAFFFAQASGDMNVQMDLMQNQIVSSFGHVMCNAGNHYDHKQGIFTAPCDGLYLCSVTLRYEIGENVKLGLRRKSSNGKEYQRAIIQITTINSSASVTTPFSLTRNDQIYISSNETYKGIKFHGCSYFMCVLINKA